MKKPSNQISFKPSSSINASRELGPAMSIDPFGLVKNSDETSTRDDNSMTGLGHVRSYRCSFCKRGFSNAQALGGHMNIHRKDRAKLREFSDENLLSLDINKSMDSGESTPANSSVGEDQTRKGGLDGKVDDLHDVVPTPKEDSIRSLLLFADAPSVICGDDDDDDDGGAAGHGRFDKHIEIKRRMELVHGEVDLELRLGPEPHDAKINQ